MSAPAQVRVFSPTKIHRPGYAVPTVLVPEDEGEDGEEEEEVLATLEGRFTLGSVVRVHVPDTLLPADTVGTLHYGERSHGDRPAPRPALTYGSPQVARRSCGRAALPPALRAVSLTPTLCRVTAAHRSTRSAR